MQSSKQLTAVVREWAKVFMHRSGRDFKRFMDETNLSFSQISVLMGLMHKGNIGISDIGGQLGVSNAAASQAVDRLVQMDLIERNEDPEDRRSKRLTLTREGYRLVKKGIEARGKWIERLTDTLTPEQQNMIISALTLLTEAAQKLRD
jgi:DNA-binding MarR family transcriptional regulator